MRRYLKRFSFTKKPVKKEGMVGEDFSGYKLEGMRFHKSNPRRFMREFVEIRPLIEVLKV